MTGGRLTKVMKYELTYLDGCGEFKDMQRILWDLQRQTREILNRTIQTAYHWDDRSREHFKETGEYLDVKRETGYKSLDGAVYDRMKNECSLSGANLNATVRKAWQKYKDAKGDVLKGDISLPSYKSNQPLVLSKDSIKLKQEEQRPIIELTVLSNPAKKELDAGNPRFALLVKDGTQRAILERLAAGEYTLGNSQLVYKKPKWFLFLSYSFLQRQLELDPNKILGVDMGEVYAVCASVFGDKERLILQGGEVTEFSKRIEARRRSMQKQAAVCGDGRKGHGTKTRVANVYRVEDKIAAFRDTINHRYSKAVVDYAVAHGCGAIQVEELKGIKEDLEYPRYLRHWTYYDLQQKIENKAKENGILFTKIDPQFTSQRCSVCGNIDPKNRTAQARFICTQCGFQENADFNASQNISIKGIDTIIRKTTGANTEQEDL